MRSLIVLVLWGVTACLIQARPFRKTPNTPSYSFATGDNLQVPLKPAGFIGISDIVTVSQASTPLDLSTVHLSDPSPPTKKFEMASIQSTEDYDAAFSVAASAQGSYGGFTGSASAKYMQSKTLTSTSSLYMMFFEKQLGNVYLNADAKLSVSAEKLLLTDPFSFAKLYGKYYIYGMTVGCQASSTVKLTAKSEQDKKSLDVAAKASYQDMFSASADFTGNMKKQSGFSALSVDVFVNGGDVPAVVSTIPEVKKLILDPLDTGGKCSSQNAVVSKVLVRGWLSFKPIAELQPKNPKIVDALSPDIIVSPGILSRINDVLMKTQTLIQLTDKCHQNVFSCATKQWNEPTKAREDLYTQAYGVLIPFLNTLQKVTEVTLKDTTVVLKFEQDLEKIYLKYLRPAEALTPFTFHFTIRVLNWYDDYQDPPPVGTKDLTGSFTIDPNHEDTYNNDIDWNTKPQIDDGHANCHHFYGTFRASFKRNVLSAWQIWSRVCGSSDVKTNVVKFYPGGDTSATTEYDTAVRTVYSFTVEYLSLPNL